MHRGQQIPDSLQHPLRLISEPDNNSDGHNIAHANDVKCQQCGEERSRKGCIDGLGKKCCVRRAEEASQRGEYCQSCPGHQVAAVDHHDIVQVAVPRYTHTPIGPVSQAATTVDEHAIPNVTHALPGRQLAKPMHPSWGRQSDAAQATTQKMLDEKAK